MLLCVFVPLGSVSGLFWADFWAILGRFLPPKMAPESDFGPILAPKMTPKSDLGLILAPKMALKSDLIAPRSPPGQDEWMYVDFWDNFGS